MAARESKVQLSLAIRDELKSRAKTIKDLAEEVDVPESSVRAWLSRNRWPKREIVAIAAALKLGTDLKKLKQKFQFETTQERQTPRRQQQALSESPPESLAKAISLFEERAEQIANLYSQFEVDVRTLFHAMKRDDVFVYCSLTGVPFEQDHSHVGSIVETVLMAVKNGAYFIYLHPPEDLLNEMSIRGHVAWNAGQWSQRFRLYKAELKDFALRRHDEQLAERVDEHVQNVISSTREDWIPFIVPHLKFVLFGYNDESSKERRYKTMAYLPVGGRDAGFVNLPVPEGLHGDFLRFVKYVRTSCKDEAQKRLLQRLVY